jgi:hypothetical protein
MVKIPTEDFEIFRKNYPYFGAWTWFVRECVRRFNDLHPNNTDEILDETVSGIKGGMEDGEIPNEAGYGSPLQSEAE